MNDSEDQKIAARQLPALLRTAAELQARAEGRPDESLTLEEVEQIAAEVGIPASYVRHAAQTLQPIRENIVNGALGPSALHSVEAHVQLRFGAAQAQALLGSAAAQLGMAAAVYDDSMPGVFRIGIGRRAAVQVSSDGSGTRIAVLTDRRVMKAAVLTVSAAAGALVGTQLGFATAVGAADPVTTVSYLMPIGGVIGGMAGVLSGRYAWTLIARSWYRRMRDVLTDVIAEVHK